MDVGTALRLSRALARESQIDAASAMGVSPSSLRLYESGRRAVPDDVLARAVEHFGLTPWLREVLLSHPLATAFRTLFETQREAA